MVYSKEGDNMKKKKIFIGLIVLIFIVLHSTIVFGTNFNLDNVISDTKNWINNPVTTPTVSVNKVSNKGYETANRIAGALTVIGIFAAAIIGIVLGIKYMLSSGVEQKADVKKTMMPWIIGTGIVLGALSIWRLLLKLLNEAI